ncbi:hypothetical protein FCL53_17030 [Elizabethkingia meningoseptica]|uniref:hypothetical protein n=1 Tax=Elizabethkingia meningoseptica TaxID=238 RepID=UPI00136573BD|nr:hypothetical protein [Elizabethkingia meningoseptica]MVW93668.1 hypothetical protein [Elizabethkingia meningoseptica]
MKTLDQIKDEVAKEFGYSSFENSIFYGEIDIRIIDEVAKRYAREVAQASLEKAAENANIKYHDGHNKLYKAVKHVQIGADNIQIDKESITNPNNITLL